MFEGARRKRVNRDGSLEMMFVCQTRQSCPAPGAGGAGQCNMGAREKFLSTGGCASASQPVSSEKHAGASVQ